MGRLLKQAKEDAEQDARDREHRQHGREVAELKNKLARAERKLKQAEGDLEEKAAFSELWEQLNNTRPVPIDRLPKRKPSGTATAILCCSDWHVEEPVYPESCNGLNEYNLEIADKRIQTIFQKTVELIEVERHASNIKDLVVWLGGDFITGHIHPELEESNLLSPTEACNWVEERIIGGLEFLLKESGCKSITVPTNYGNHGRTTAKIRFSTGHKNSFEQGMYWHLRRHMRSEPRIQFKIENGYSNILEVQGKLIRFAHGNALRYQGGIQGPSGGILRWISNANKATPCWLDIFGHLHTDLQDRLYVGNPSLIGHGAASPYFGGGFCEPFQKLVIVDRNQNRPTCVKPVFCE